MEFTSPLVDGVQDVIRYGATALKLKTLSRVYVVPFWLILVKRPTANMVVPHCTSCLTCSVLPEGASAGVPAAGWVDTRPGLLAAGASANAPTTSALAATVTPLRARWPASPRIMPPVASVQPTSNTESARIRPVHARHE